MINRKIFFWIGILYFILVPSIFAEPPTLPENASPIGPALTNVQDLDTSFEEDSKKFNPIIDLAGALEFEFHRDKTLDSNNNYAFKIDTFELDFTLYVNDVLQGFISIENDEDSNYQTIFKESYFTIGGTEKYPYFLKMGKQFVPFGLGDGALLGDTLSVTDPLSIDIFETSPTAYFVGKKWGDYRTGIYVFERKIANIRTHTQFGASFYKGRDDGDFAYAFGFDFLSSVFNSDGLQAAYPNALSETFVPGLSLHARYFNYGISIITEAEFALKKASFTQNHQEYHLAPKAWMLELGYVKTLFNIKSYAAVDYSESYEVEGAFAKNRLLAVVGIYVFDNTTVAFEYGKEHAYKKSSGGNGENGQSFILQVAVSW